ncbi:MAG TPA: hypothetical protein VKZ50_18375 [bacterium]|nr:hypothetical protein [bacterium]
MVLRARTSSTGEELSDRKRPLKTDALVLSLITMMVLALASGAPEAQTASPQAPAPASTPVVLEPCAIDPAVDGPWLGTVAAFEHFDMGRSHLFRCASFGGRFDGRNDASYTRLPETYVTPYNIVTGAGGARFVYAGAYGDFPNVPGSFVAKIDAAGKELWRRQLFDARAHPRSWNYPGVVGLHRNGFVYVVYGTALSKLSPSTGAVLATVKLPTIGASADTAYNGFDGFADGDLVMKAVSRAAGCQEQGFSAFLKCPHPTAVPHSVIAVVNPNTMTLVAKVEAPEFIGGRLTTTRYHGKDLLYLMGGTSIFRYIWNGRDLQLDKAWGPIPYLKRGQTAAPAAAIMGDWVVAQTNGLPGDTPLSLVAARQSDGKFMSTQPFAKRKLGEGTLGAKSFLPSMLTVDAPNGRIYVMDGGQGLVAAISFDRQTGTMRELWRAKQRTLNFSTLIGSKSHRVFLATDIGGPCPRMICLQRYNKEVIVFRNAATGQEIARSSALPKMTSGALLTPGERGVIYYLGLAGSIYQVTVAAR